MICKKCNVSVLLLFLFTGLVTLNLINPLYVTGTDWPQLGRDPARSNYTPDTPPLAPQVRWVWKPPNSAKIGAQVQPVVAQNVIVIGATDGKVYGINISSGTTRWTFTTGGPIIHTSAIDNGIAYVGSADGKLYAINLLNGTSVWTFQGTSGFYVAPLVVNGKVYAAEVDGWVYCIDSNTGAQIWKTGTDSPILCCPAYGDNKIYIGSEDMYAHAFDANTGTEVWKTRLYGIGFMLYWPVYSSNTVVFRTRRMYSNGPDVIVDWTLNILVKSQYCDDSDDDYTATQQEIRDYLTSHPDEKTFFVLDTSNGQERFVAPVAMVARHQDCPLPPVLDSNGNFCVPIRVRSSAICGFSFASGYNTCDGTWGSIVPDFARLNLTTGLFERIGSKHCQWQTGTFRMCCDDMSIFTVASHYFLGIHEPDNLGYADMNSPYIAYHPGLNWDVGGDHGNSGVGYNPLIVVNGVIYNHNHLGNGSVAALW